MAFYWGNWRDDDWRIGMTVTSVKDTDTYVDLKLAITTLEVNWGITTNYGNSITFKCNGESWSKDVGNVSSGASIKGWEHTFRVYKNQDIQWVDVSGSLHVSNYSAGTSTASGTYSIPARVLKKQGNPTLTAKQNSVNYKESVQLSWGKASNQGNANFDRFELWNGNTKIYSGAGLSKVVIPSDYTGAKGGDTTFTIKEIHEWYGTYPTTQSTKVIKVRSGAITVYDSNGKKHTGLLTAYDSKGKAHSVLISGYDSKGNKKSVV